MVAVLFFDGVCGLCNWFINFLLRHDTRRVLSFSPLQGEFIKTSPASYLCHQESVILLIEGRILQKSSAILESVALLGGRWRGARLFLWIPVCIRDALYDLVARHRYKLFGKKETCRVPTKQEQEQFLP
ncbi:MAG: DUF393 domain-containing protein [Chlamydiae bacterium]|nr:DUF393 domain-containing protein [Chlamydiota bacterium]